MAIWRRVFSQAEITRIHALGRQGKTFTEELTAQARFTSIRVQGAQIVLAWEGAGTLQRSTDLVNWTDVTGARSPYQVPITPGGNLFFRVRQ